jgi:hypothetical protein
VLFTQLVQLLPVFWHVKQVPVHTTGGGGGGVGGSIHTVFILLAIVGLGQES